MDTAETIRMTERRRLAALVTRDLEAAKALHHPDFQLVTPRGFVLSREAYFAELSSGGLTYLAWEPGEMAVRWSTDMAVIRYRARIDMLSDGEPMAPFECWHTDSYERKDGPWRAVFSQATQISAPAAG